MNEQVSMFETAYIPETFEGWMERILFEVLDRNTIEHKHLAIQKNKGYWSVKYRGGIVFTYCFTSKRRWIRFPIRYAHHLPSDLEISSERKQGSVTLTPKDDEQARQLSGIYAAALNEAIDNGVREYSCCSRYQECSDAGHCINPYPDIAIECRYKINLKHGRNFYKRDMDDSTTTTHPATAR